MGVLLTDTHEDDRFSCGVDHVEGGAHLLIDSVKFGKDNTVDCARVRVGDGIVNQGLIELCELINRIIANEGLSNEEDNIRVVNVHELRQSLHQVFVALHSSCCINE